MSDRRRGQRLFRLLLLLTSLPALGLFALGDEPILRVARVSLLQGEVSYQRAGSPNNDWFDATINTPLGENDQLYTGSGGRVEVQFTGRNLVRLDHNTNLKITQFTTGTTQLALSVGTATFRIESLDRRQFELVSAKDPDRDEPLYFEVDTPTVAVTFLKDGSYRLNVLEDGTTEVIVRRGQAEVYNQAFGTIPVRQGRRMTIEGSDVEAWRVTKLEDKDEWDRWNDRRNDELYARTELRSSRYVPYGVAGLYELDYYGDWYDTPDYGWVWSPRIVTVGWAPYRSGYWRWYPAYGWTWISYEPWGWAPYHYGRWAYYRSRWCWVPHGGFGVTLSSWSWHPSLVVFFGWGGGGYRSGYRDGYRNGYRDGYYDRVGWIPLAPGERYFGSYGRTVVNNTVVNNTTIINNNPYAGRDPGPRAVTELKNYSVPGGVTGVEGRRFTGPRVVVDENNPPQQIANTRLAGSLRDAVPLSGRTVELQPRQVEAPRPAPAASAAVSRRMSSGVVTRRATEAPSSGLNPTGDATRSIERGTPALRGTGDSSNSVRSLPVDRSRSAGTENLQPDRSRRVPEFRPVERTVPPSAATRRSASEDSSEINRSFGGARSVERGADRGSERSIERNSGTDRSIDRSTDRGSERRIERTEPPRSREPYSAPPNENRSGDRPTWSAPRRADPPAERPRAEPREVPRERPVERSVERPVERRADPPARTERPSSPPAERSRPAEQSHGERGRGRPISN
ncbi:MAG TPA: DUF6600 domain-containing protein [Blastocatellia bacterium]|nr:DUF6600 domain-containing protein [Blastocatellia bacterium]